jgi:hyperosmotically inducible periplasmic protein
MKTINSLITVAVVWGSVALFAAVTTPPDNTKVNERDQSVTEKTAEQQGTSDRDLTLAQKIRQELVRDDSLSTYAHNVKVIAENGRVTLKGPVRSAEEKSKVVASAKRIAGANSVVDELQIAP